MNDRLLTQPSGDSVEPADLGTALQATLLAHLYRIDEHLKHRGRHPHGAIHQVRKAVRGFRSILALCVSVHPGMLSRVDASIRGIGKKLSRLRDAHVAAETVTAMRQQSDKGELWRDARTALKKARDDLLTRMLADDPAFARLRKRAVAGAEKVVAVSFSALTCEEVVLALRESAARMRKAERDAKESPRPAARHRWRRRVLRLRLQLECFEEIAHDDAVPAAVRVEARWVLGEALDTMPSAAILTSLADKLGAQQDLAGLKAALRRQDDLPFRDELLHSLERRRAT